MAGLPEVGSVFGRYRVDALLGRGAMGVVYLATDVAINRYVALKVVASEHVDSQDLLARFEREATALAKMASPHVINIFEYGTENGLPYIATQYVSGGDLGALLQLRGPMPPTMALEIVGQVAEALDAAHHAGIVHRDVKPTNVLIRDEAAGPLHAYLCDFGVARTATTALTAPGTVAGTWGYLAPECGRGAPATPASDIYALGCLLYAALAGAAPYVGSDVEVALAHQQQPIPQLTDPSPASAAINEVLRRSMAKKPEDRYSSAAEMRQALRAITNPGDVPLAPLPPASLHDSTNPSGSTAPSRAHHASTIGAQATGQPPRRRRRAIVAVCCATVLAIGAGVAAAFVLDRNDEPAPGGGEDQASIRGDINGDGFGDFVLAIPHTQIVDGVETSVSEKMVWNSDGTELAPQLPPELLDDDDTVTTLMLLGDFDGDGTSEVLRIEVPVRLQDGPSRVRGTTSSGVEIDYEFTRDLADREYWPFVADMNGDGLDDIVYQAATPTAGQSFEVSSRLQRDITILASFSNGSGFNDVATMYDFPETTAYLHFGFGDFDGDGDADMVSDQFAFDERVGDLPEKTHRLTVYRSSGTTLEPGGSQDIPESNWGPLIGMDTDGDGDDELVTKVPGEFNILSVYDFDPDADGSTAWSKAEGTAEVPDRPYSSELLAAASDVDGDGDDDLVIAVVRKATTRLRVVIAEAEDGRFTMRRTRMWAPEITDTNDYGVSYAVGENLMP